MHAGMKQQHESSGPTRRHQSVDNSNVQNEPRHQLEMLRSKAQAADKAGRRDVAMGYWQDVLQIEPTNFQASRAGESSSSCSVLV